MAERKPNRKLTDQEVEYMLAKAVVQQVPDIYQQASSAPITPLTVVDEIVPRQFPQRRLHWQRLAAACVLLVLCAGGIFSWLWFSTKAVVSIDVFEYVIDTQAGNTDGAEVLDDLSLKNLKLSTALDALMGAMSRKGYLTDDAQISVFVDGSDDDFNRELYDEITDDLAHLAPDAVTQVGESATAQPDTQQPAEQQTVEQPATEQPVTEQPSAEQTTEQPATDQTTEQPVTGQTTGQTGEQQPQQSASITEEQAKEIAASHAGVAVADLTFHSVSLEEDDGRPPAATSARMPQKQLLCSAPGSPRIRSAGKSASWTRTTAASPTSWNSAPVSTNMSARSKPSPGRFSTLNRIKRQGKARPVHHGPALLVFYRRRGVCLRQQRKQLKESRFFLGVVLRLRVPEGSVFALLVAD